MEACALNYPILRINVLVIMDIQAQDAKLNQVRLN